jgi:superfamily II RNA helicase
MNNLEIEDIITFPYKLDDFQENAMLAILQDEHILCTAATGSGKTAISEFAIALSVKRNKRAIYTAPIKALSNQKYGELQSKNKFKEKFEVGIKTGDLKVNPDAQVLVGTTEIFNNLLYTDPLYFNDVQCLIIDEAHYIRDDERGTVYEEIITMCPKHCTLVLLSATIPGAEKFAKWVTHIKQKKCGIYSNEKRVVPLTHLCYWDHKFTEIMNNEKVIYEKNYRNHLQLWKEQCDKNKIKTKKIKVPSKSKLLEDFCDELNQKKLLPALFFVFSRKKCEVMAKMYQKSLLTGKEATDIINLFDFYVKRFLGGENGLRIAQVWMIRSLLQKGICVHHSGMIPILKEIVETLFQKGHIKLLFCTTSLACGVNLPVKTAIFGETQIFDGTQKSFLTPELYYQCAGRAGRRGLDSKGSVIYFPINENMISFSEISDIFLGALTQIKSKFEMNPTLLLKCFSIQKSPYDLFENSLMSYEVSDFIIGENYKLQTLNTKLSKIQNIIQENIIENCDSLYKELRKNETQLQSSKPNERKKILNRNRCIKQSLSPNILESLYENDKLLSEIKKIQKSIVEAQNYVIDTIIWQIDILKNTGYINLSSEELKIEYNDFIHKKTKILPPSCVTVIGKIASTFNEVDSFFMTEFICEYMKTNKDNDENTMILIWSVLLGSLVDKEKSQSIDGFMNVDDMISVLTDKGISDVNTTKIKNYFAMLSKNLNNCKSENRIKNYEFELNYEFAICVFLWIHGSTYNDISSQNLCDIFEGNFVKNILKIHNICEELKQSFQILNNHSHTLLFEKIQSQLIKDIVVIDSLYVTS